MQPPQPPPQEAQTNSGSSIDYDQILDVLTSMEQGLQNQAKKIGEMKTQLGEIVDFIGKCKNKVNSPTPIQLDNLKSMNLSPWKVAWRLEMNPRRPTQA